MADYTQFNNFPLLKEKKAEPDGEEKHNRTVWMLDALAGLWRVVNKTETSPPSSPTAGQAWLVASGGSGTWDGKDGKLAIYTGSGWLFLTPQEATLILDLSTDNVEVYDGTAWQAIHSNAW